MNRLMGLPIYESVMAVKDGEPYAVRRSWRTRLFGRPWRPWVTHTWVTPKVPTYIVTPHAIIAHPAVVKTLAQTFGSGR